MTIEECKEALKPWLHDAADDDPEWWLEVANEMPEVPINELFVVTTSIMAKSDWDFTGVERVKGGDGARMPDCKMLRFVDSSNPCSTMSLTYDEAVRYLSDLEI